MLDPRITVTIVKKTRQIIQNLSPADGLAILKILANADEQIAVRIGEVATTYLSEVDPEDVAGGLYEELDSLQVEEVWDRAGSTRHGYMEPYEAAYQMIEEILDPYFADLRKYQQLNMPRQAMHLCMGLLQGFYLFEHESTSEFKNWATDAPLDFAQEVVAAWKAEFPSADDVLAVKEFIAGTLGIWGVRLV